MKPEPDPLLIAGRQSKLERDLQIARQIQVSFLPDELPQIPGWELAARFQPAREVSGDFYDAFPLTNNRRLGLVIADVCDKGIGAALFMALFRTLIRAFAQQHYSLSWTDALGGKAALGSRLSAPGTPLRGVVEAAGRPASSVPSTESREPRAAPKAPRRQAIPSTGSGALKNAVSLTNSYILRNHGQSGMFATLFFAVLDPATGALAYVNCGHNPPILIGQNGRTARLTATGPALGIMPDADFAIEQAQLEPGDLLIGYTDGVTEARNPRGEFFSDTQLLSLVQPGAPSAETLLDRIEGSVCAHVNGGDPSDDMTMLAVRRASSSDAS
jgi:phosphoserine phosphatase RsbU/P